MIGSGTVDFVDNRFNTVQPPNFSGHAASGTLHVTDGTHTAAIALLGNYRASTFVASNDSHGGTVLVDPRQTTA